MFQHTHNNLQNSSGRGWRVPVASLSHRPSLFIQLNVVMKKENKKDFPQMIWVLSVASNGCSGTSRPDKSHKHLSEVLCCRHSNDEMGRQTISLWCYPCSLKSLMEHISSWNVTVLLHILQESVSAEIITHSSWNMCKLFLAVALRGYGPQSLPSVQFLRCAVQHKSDQNWPRGSWQWALLTGKHWNTLVGSQYIRLLLAAL